MRCEHLSVVIRNNRAFARTELSNLVLCQLSVTGFSCWKRCCSQGSSNQIYASSKASNISPSTGSGSTVGYWLQHWERLVGDVWILMHHGAVEDTTSSAKWSCIFAAELARFSLWEESRQMDNFLVKIETTPQVHRISCVAEKMNGNNSRLSTSRPL